MVDYDRELIAWMMESCEHAYYTRPSLAEQARLLREADNADAAGVHTATQPPAVGVDVTDEMVERVEQTVGMGHTAWDMVDPKELIRAAAAALRTGGGSGHG